MLPILQALEEMGGSGIIAEVVDRVGEILFWHTDGIGL